MNLLTQYRGLRKEIYILFIGRIVTNLGSMVYPVLTLVLNQKMGLSASGVSLVTIISGLIFLPSGIIGGKIADKFNKKNIIIICDIISVSLYIICAFVPLSYITIVIFLIAGICQSLEGPSYDALLADITETKDRERAYSLLYLGANIGLVASPTIAGLLFKNYLWLSFLISGIAIGLSTLLIFLKIKDVTPVKEEGGLATYQESDEKASLFKVLKNNKVIVLYLIIMGFYWSAYNQYNYLMPIDLARVHGDDGAVIFGSVSSLNCIVVVLFTPLLTKIFAKMTNTKMSLMGMIAVLLGYVIFLLFLGNIPFYYVAITMFTIGEILSTIANGPYISSRIPQSHRGRVNGFAMVLQGVLTGTIMYSTGVIFDCIGSKSAWIFIFIVLGIGIIGAFALIFLDKKRYKELY